MILLTLFPCRFAGTMQPFTPVPGAREALAFRYFPAPNMGKVSRSDGRGFNQDASYN
jgi:hypothetical protein